MRFSLPTRIIAIVAVVALAAVFAAPAQAAGAPGIARTDSFSWLRQPVLNWISLFFGVDLSRPASPATDPGLQQSREAGRAEIIPDGGSVSSASTATGSTTLFVGGSS